GGSDSQHSMGPAKRNTTREICTRALLSRERRKRKAERQTKRELPVGRRSADAASDTDVQKQVLGRRLPDETEQIRVVRPLALDALAVDLADEPKLRIQRQLSDDTP